MADNIKTIEKQLLDLTNTNGKYIYNSNIDTKNIDLDSISICKIKPLARKRISGIGSAVKSSDVKQVEAVFYIDFYTKTSDLCNSVSEYFYDLFKDNFEVTIPYGKIFIDNIENMNIDLSKEWIENTRYKFCNKIILNFYYFD